jgi:hypothetical protein
MQSIYLRVLAGRCRAAARNCCDLGARQEFRDIADELIRKADELDGFGTSIMVMRRRLAEGEQA